MNSYQAQLSTFLSRVADFLASHLVGVGVAFALLVLLLIWISRRSEIQQRSDDEPVTPPLTRRVPPYVPPPQAPPTFPPPPSMAPAVPPPAVPPPAVPPPAHAPHAADPLPPGARRALLVVDDSAVARAKLRKLFEGAGYRVELARDGVEALQLLPTAFFSVLVTDLEMPNMDGLELIATVQGSLETEDLPVIAITGHDELQARVHEVEGLFGIFRKPWNDRDLLRRVEALATMRKPDAAQTLAAAGPARRP